MDPIDELAAITREVIEKRYTMIKGVAALICEYERRMERCSMIFEPVYAGIIDDLRRLVAEQKPTKAL